MTMIDLTPKAYLNRCRAHAVMRRWLCAAGACLMFTVMSVGVGSVQRPDDSTELTRERIAQARSRQVQNSALAQTYAAQLKQLDRELQASSHLTRRPDWSAVMRRVAAQFQDEMVMTGARLGTVTDSQVRAALGPAGVDAPVGSVWLVLTGVAASNSDVPGLILRLETMGLFDRVLMTGTQRETFAGASRIGFVLACRVE
jgi:hypothetical protein